MSCIMVLGTAFLIPKWATASTNRLWSCGVQTRRGRFRVRAGSSPPPPSSDESNSPEFGCDDGVEIAGGCWWCWSDWWWWLSGIWELPISKAIARSGVIRVWDKGISSSGFGSSSSHFENQLDSSSFISGYQIKTQIARCSWDRVSNSFDLSLSTKIRDLMIERRKEGRGVRGGFSSCFLILKQSWSVW